MSDSKIEWTDKTWNPIVGCSIVSPGCTNCYAMKQAERIQRMDQGRYETTETHYTGTTKVVNGNPVWTGKVVRAPEHIMSAPSRWKKPARIFVNSMGDLFHENIPDEWIDRVFGVMAFAPQHKFQILTKRSKRMREYCAAPRHQFWPIKWPFPNVWLGVSAEDQPGADERIPDLLATPAAVRFVSAEPLLGPIDFGAVVRRRTLDGSIYPDGKTHPLGWIIVGGESGSGARPMALEWANSIVAQTGAAGVKCFVKQLGACPTLRGEAWPIKNRKGADIDEWPEPLRVREFP